MEYLYFLFLLIPLLILLFKLYVVLTCGVCRSKNSMEGKIVVITGANSGIGLETAKDIARRNGRVILACRNKKLGSEAAELIVKETGNSNVVFQQLDLSSLDSVRKFAAEVNATESRLDVLIHNAGVGCEPKLTEDNLDVTFATNHFGPFLLTHLLLDLMKKSAPSRIVVVASELHHVGKLDFDNLNCEKHKISTSSLYNNSKLANVLMVKELARRLEGTGVTANALHPGVIRTGIFKDMGLCWMVVRALLYPFMKTPAQGAQTSIHLAVSDDVENVTGKYFVDCKPGCSPFTNDKEKARRLWEISEKFTGISKE